MITVKYFSTIQEITGKKNERLHFIGTKHELLDWLIKKYPKLDKLKKNIIVSVNFIIADNKHQIKDNDEIGLMPPFQGG